MKTILGISAFYHDSAAALISGGRIVAAAQEERFTRQKHTADFPVNAIKYCLEEGGFSIDELDAVVFYDKPMLKFERLLETYYAFAPSGLISFLKAIPVWLKEKLFLKNLIYKGLAEAESYNKKALKLLFSEHHLSHAASAFFASPYDKAAILTIDGVGEWSTASLGFGDGTNIKIHKELHFPHSVGLLYSAFTYFLGFSVNSGEYKLMGLAPYGDENAEQTSLFKSMIKEQLVDINEDGSIWLNQKFFNYATGLKMIHEKRWENLFGFGRRAPESELTQTHCNLALAIQQVTEDIVIKMAQELKKLTGTDNLCLAGGVALNCVANARLLKEGIFKNIYIQPAAGDAGGALGAALATDHIYFASPRYTDGINDQMQGTYLGPEFSDMDVEKMCKKVKAVYKHQTKSDTLFQFAANCIAEGNVVGWFRGRMEFGPRALGNRSILGDARNPEMQKKLNLKIKYREGFRPFAPSVLNEVAGDYFDLQSTSPYMLLTAPVKKSRRLSLPADYASLTLWDKLYHLRSDIQAVTHLDYSARLQTVHKETNPDYWNLIEAFRIQTGYGVIVNTSFNVRGEPIVCTPFDAYKCFMATDMDYLVINNFIFSKTDQPDSEQKGKWKTNFKPD